MVIPDLLSLSAPVRKYGDAPRLPRCSDHKAKVAPIAALFGRRATRRVGLHGRSNAIVFMNTSGDILNDDQRRALQDYIHQGGGFVAIHSASFTMMEWPWYVKLVGGVWNRHPSPGISTAIVNNEDPNHPSTSHLPGKWVVTEEWYNYLELSDNIKVALTIDETTYTGGKMPDYHPIAWYQEDFEGGRSFHTGLGHPEGIYDNPWYRQHILGAVWWAATGGKASE